MMKVLVIRAAGVEKPHLFFFIVLKQNYWTPNTVDIPLLFSSVNNIYFYIESLLMYTVLFMALVLLKAEVYKQR